MSLAGADFALTNPDLRHEHVQLESEAEAVDAACLTPTRTDALLVSESPARRQRVEIFNGTGLRVVTSSRRGEPREFRLDLAFLDPEPEECTTRTWWWLGVGCGALAAGAVGTMASGWAPVAATPWLALAAVAGLAACVGGVLLHRASRRTVFRTRHGRVPLLVLWPRDASARAVREFAARVQSAAAEAARKHLEPRGHLLRDEMRAHRRLYEEDTISQDMFEDAKKRILAAHG